uniref:Capsid protein n=1 Tax=Cowpea mild mottle virus TaxID=67761 RepID=A0A8A5P2W1_9VIRU|nr:coat protein [Cowpea mild mottle virus]
MESVFDLNKLLDSEMADKTKTGVPKAADGTALPDIDAELQKRLDDLRAFLRKTQSASEITNPGFELGRPALKESTFNSDKHTHIYGKWSIDQLSRIVPKKISNNMATAEEMAKVQITLEGLGVPTEHVAEVLLQVAIYCKDVSSSSFMDSSGTFDWKGGSILSDSVIAALRKDDNTLRRVCRLYAPITWNFMLTHKAPPSDWAAMGFKYSDRVAAFDCFEYVENPAAIQPAEGLIRKPTPSEKIAHNTYKRLALDRSNRNELYANLNTEVTGGTLGPEISRNFNHAKK